MVATWGSLQIYIFSRKRTYSVLTSFYLCGILLLADGYAKGKYLNKTSKPLGAIMKTAIAYIRVSRQTDVSSIHSVETQRSMVQ